MNNFPPLRTPHSALRNTLAFTLIEMLVVIAIIGILAALIVGGAGIASAKARISRVQTERDALITAIERYQKNKGYYPPDNTNDTVQNMLFYELTGTILVGNPPGPYTFNSGISGENLKAAKVLAFFNVGGPLNASADPAMVVNFYPGMKANQHLIVNSFNPSGFTFTVMGVPVPGPTQLNAATGVVGLPFINPWHYNASHPTNNVDSYDLWMDVILKGVTNRISNWSKDPQPL